MPSLLHLQRSSFTPPTDCQYNKKHPTTVQLLHHPRDGDDDDENIRQVPEYVARHHTRTLSPNQCCSAVVQCIDAPVSKVWSVIRRFDKPQVYKHFLKSCRLIHGEGDVGTIREVHVVSGLPAASSTERLEILDEERHVISFSVVGGEHRLSNYRSVTTLHPAVAAAAAEEDGGGSTVVVESYVVDIPPGNTKEDTCSFIDTIVGCNLQSLAQIAVNMDRGKEPSIDYR